MRSWSTETVELSCWRGIVGAQDIAGAQRTRLGQQRAQVAQQRPALEDAELPGRRSHVLDLDRWHPASGSRWRAT